VSVYERILEILRECDDEAGERKVHEPFCGSEQVLIANWHMGYSLVVNKDKGPRLISVLRPRMISEIPSGARGCVGFARVDFGLN
jgi:hypothetical protein